MILTTQLVFILLAVTALGVWGIVSGLRQSRNTKLESPISPQELSSLAQPFRQLMGEAVTVHKDMIAKIEQAPKVIEENLKDIALRMTLLLKLAYPRAQHGSQMLAYLQDLNSEDAEAKSIKESADNAETELRDFLSELKTLKNKVYTLLSNASEVTSRLPLEQDLKETFAEVENLEKIFEEVKQQA